MDEKEKTLVNFAAEVMGLFTQTRSILFKMELLSQARIQQARSGDRGELHRLRRRELELEAGLEVDMEKFSEDYRELQASVLALAGESPETIQKFIEGDRRLANTMAEFREDAAGVLSDLQEGLGALSDKKSNA